MNLKIYYSSDPLSNSVKLAEIETVIIRDAKIGYRLFLIESDVLPFKGQQDAANDVSI